MKTMVKMIFPALVLMGSTMTAQTAKKSKACIKLDKNENGVVTKIDTCFESTDPKEVEAFLVRMGVNETGGTTVTSGNGGQCKKIVIKNDENENGKTNSYSYTYDTNNADSMNVMVWVDDKGNVTTTGAGDAKVIVREFNGNEADLNNEIQTIIEEETTNGNGSGTHKKVMVIVTKKVEVTDVSTEERKKLPENLKNVKGNDFEDLSVYPNPSNGNFSVKFKGNTNEELTIKLFDAMGKEVMVEKEISGAKEFSKSIDVSGLKKGVYFLQLTQGKKAQMKKVVIAE